MVSWAEHRLLFPRYNRWLAARLRPFLGRRVWEVRCGQGHLTEWLLDRAFVLAMDPSAENLSVLQNRLGHPVNVHTLVGHLAELDIAEVQSYACHTVLCANALEHLEDDGAALDRMGAVLPAGGKLVAVVAAFGNLFNALDRGAGHLRRYDKRPFSAQLARHGFVVRRAFYVNSLGLLGWWIRGSLLGREEPSPGQLRFFDRLAPTWATIEQQLAFPAGLSLVCVAERRDNRGARA